MSEDTQPQEGRIEENVKAYGLLINDDIMYLRFRPALYREDVPALDTLLEKISTNAKRLKYYVFDLTELKKFDLRCCRPFALAQNEARKQSSASVVTIQPELPSIKKLMLDQGIIRPREICESRSRLYDFVKNIERAQKKKEENS